MISSSSEGRLGGISELKNEKLYNTYSMCSIIESRSNLHTSKSGSAKSFIIPFGQLHSVIEGILLLIFFTSQ